MHCNKQLPLQVLQVICTEKCPQLSKTMHPGLHTVQTAHQCCITNDPQLHPGTPATSAANPCAVPLPTKAPNFSVCLSSAITRYRQCRYPNPCRFVPATTVPATTVHTTNLARWFLLDPASHQQARVRSLQALQERFCSAAACSTRTTHHQSKVTALPAARSSCAALSSL